MDSMHGIVKTKKYIARLICRIFSPMSYIWDVNK
mgnify:CR=1 FL=1